MKPTDEAIEAAVAVFNNMLMIWNTNQREWSRAILEAAYAAQFQR